MKTLSRVRPSKKTRDLVLERLRSAILCGKLLPGTCLVERDLAEEMKVSRTPVREALGILVEEMLVERLPVRGLIVAQTSREEIMQLYTMRAELEGLAVRWFCQHINRRHVAYLENLLKRMEKCVQEQEIRELVGYDNELHEAIIRFSKSQLLIRQLGSIRNKILQYRTRSIQLPGRLEKSIQEHKTLVDYIVSGDALTAEAYMKSHIYGVLEAVLHMETSYF